MRRAMAVGQRMINLTTQIRRSPGAVIALLGLAALLILPPLLRAQVPAEVQPYVEQLRSSDEEVRRDALMALDASGWPGAVPYLLERLLQDAAPVIRATAATSLGLRRAPEAVEPLIRALADKELPVRKAAIYALGHFQDPTITPHLVALLSHKEVEIRSAAALSLGGVGDQAAVPALLTSLTDKHEFVRAQAAKALGELRNEVAVAPLTLRLQADSEAEVRRASVVALGRIATPLALTAVRSVLWDKDLYVRRLAWQILHPEDPLGREPSGSVVPAPSARETGAENNRVEQ